MSAVPASQEGGLQVKRNCILRNVAGKSVERATSGRPSLYFGEAPVQGRLDMSKSQQLLGFCFSSLGSS